MASQKRITDYFIAHAEGRADRLSVYVCFSTRYHKKDAARITKLNIDTIHRESWKSVYFGVKRSEVKVTRHKTLPAWVVAL